MPGNAEYNLIQTHFKPLFNFLFHLMPYVGEDL